MKASIFNWLVYKGFNGKGVWPFRLIQWKSDTP